MKLPNPIKFITSVFRDWIYLTLIAYSVFLVLIGIYKFPTNTAFEVTHILVWTIITSIIITVFFSCLKRDSAEESCVSQGILWIVFIGTIFFSVYGSRFFFKNIYQVNWNYIALENRKTDNKECLIKYLGEDETKVLYIDEIRKEIYYDEHGLQKERHGEPKEGKFYQETDCEFFDPIVKSYVTRRDSRQYLELKSKLEHENAYVSSKHYIYWQAAVADGYKSSKKSNVVLNALYTVLEYSHLTTPSIFFILFINLIVQLATRFKYSLLNLWFAKPKTPQ